MIRWNRENTLHTEAVIFDDPLVALRAGEAEFAVVLHTGPSVMEQFPGLERVLVQGTPSRQIVFLHRRDLSPEAAAFARGV